jgi:hypothetical protein
MQTDIAVGAEHGRYWAAASLAHWDAGDALDDAGFFRERRIELCRNCI